MCANSSHPRVQGKGQAARQASLDRVAHWFDKLDENDDGNVTREELTRVVESNGGTAEQVRGGDIKKRALLWLAAERWL